MFATICICIYMYIYIHKDTCVYNIYIYAFLCILAWAHVTCERLHGARGLLQWESLQAAQLWVVGCL